MLQKLKENCFDMELLKILCGRSYLRKLEDPNYDVNKDEHEREKRFRLPRPLNQ